MKRFFQYKILLLGLLSMTVLIFSIATLFQKVETSVVLESSIAQLPPLADLTTDTWGVFDPETGQVLAGNNTDVTLPIASVTKLFTAEAVLQSSKQDDVFMVGQSDIMAEGRAGKLVAGSKVTPYELLYPLLVESSNDAAVAIERYLGDEFTNTVDTLTNELNLEHTVILEPSGLSAENVSTVHDLSLFYSYMRREHPHVLDITQLNMYINEHTGYVNNNPARSLSNFSGGKQGYTEAAKRTFVGSFKLPHSSHELGIVILQSDDLLHDINALLAHRAHFETQSDILIP